MREDDAAMRKSKDGAAWIYRGGVASEVELEAYVTSDAEPKVAIVVRGESRGRGHFGDRVETLALDEKAARQLLAELRAALESLGAELAGATFKLEARNVSGHVECRETGEEVRPV